MTKNITIKNIGPIEELSIPLPEKGGVVVLRGAQGCGKSTALQAVQAASGGSTAGLSLRDHAPKGSVEIGGAVLRVGAKRTTRSGELEVASIEGRYDIGRIIDPGIQDPERADAARLKQILSLTGSSPAHEQYRAMLDAVDPEVWTDGRFDEITSSDPADLHARMVRAMQQEARRAESEAARHRRDTTALKAELTSLPAIASDPDELQADLSRCLMVTAKLEAHLEAEAESAAMVQSAERSLEAAQQAHQGPTADSLARDLEAATAEHELHMAKAREAEKTMARLETSVRLAREHENEVARLTEILAAAPRESTTAAELAAMTHTTAKLQDELELAHQRHRLQRNLHEAHEANLVADACLERAAALRKAAEDSEQILGQALPDVGIVMRDGRLCARTDRSERELFGELSHGERGILAIRLAVPHVPAGGLCVVSQEVWSGISPANQQLIAAEAMQHNITILTADVDDAPGPRPETITSTTETRHR